MSKYFINILFLLLSLPAFAQEAEEPLEEEEPAKIVAVDSFSQMRIGFDISRPVFNYLVSSRQSYEFELDYYHKNDLYFVADFGWGNAKVDYYDLKYTTNNTFFRLGINKSMIKRQSSHDWDMGFVGVRYGVAPIQRSVASYVVVDSFWGNSMGTVPAKNMTLHWAEVTAGIKVELLRNLFAGWTIRGKFRINKSSFQELPPYYIAGYGKGDKGSVFDFNFYINYAIRWRRVHKPAPQPETPVNIPRTIVTPSKDSTAQPAPANDRGLKGIKGLKDKKDTGSEE